MNQLCYLLVACAVTLSSADAHACGESSNVDMMPRSTTVDLGPIHSNSSVSYITNWSRTVAQYFKKGACVGSGFSTWAYSHEPAVGVIDGYPVYQTEYDGIGYIVRIQKDDRGPLLETPFRAWFTNSASVYTNLITAIRFVNLGGLQSGVYNLATKQAGIAVLSNSATVYSPVTSQNFYYQAFTLTITASTCTLSSGDKNQTVKLPEANVRDFGGIGTMSGSQSFHMKISCPAGITLYATMTDANLSTNRSDTLTLSSDSTASGVGIKVFAKNSATAVFYGPESAEKGNINQWKIGGASWAAATNYNIPFTARYVKTAATMSAGFVEAHTIITFSYQ